MGSPTDWMAASGNATGNWANAMGSQYNAELGGYNAKQEGMSSLLGAGATVAAAFMADGGEVGIPTGYEGGGQVSGPGGPKDDAIPAQLSDGEYVIPADVMKRKGTEFFDKLVNKTQEELSSREEMAQVAGDAMGIPPQAALHAEAQQAQPPEPQGQGIPLQKAYGGEVIGMAGGGAFNKWLGNYQMGKAGGDRNYAGASGKNYGSVMDMFVQGKRADNAYQQGMDKRVRKAQHKIRTEARNYNEARLGESLTGEGSGYYDPVALQNTREAGNIAYAPQGGKAIPEYLINRGIGDQDVQGMEQNQLRKVEQQIRSRVAPKSDFKKYIAGRAAQGRARAKTAIATHRAKRSKK